jgi:hypothetical protein
MTETKAYTTETKTHIIAAAILVELPDGSAKNLQEALTDIFVRLQDIETEVHENHSELHDLSGDLNDLLSTLRDV